MTDSYYNSVSRRSSRNTNHAVHPAEIQPIPALKRVGGVLLVVGLIDIAVMVYCIVNRISYSSGFNIFAVIAGIFLLRGSLRAASVVRWFAVFLIAGIVAMTIAWPFTQPLGLTFTQFRLNPGGAFTTFAFMAFVLGLSFWVARELGQKEVKIARASTGRKEREMRIPAALAVSLVVVMGVALALLFGGESAARAKSMAMQQVGPGYRFDVSALKVSSRGKSKFVSGVVTAWNDKEIVSIPVQWEEQ